MSPQNKIMSQQNKVMHHQKTALVLSGGGSRGAYEIGVWQALRELGIPIDMVVGTSVGALNGAMIAQGAFDCAVSLWKELETSMIFDLKEDDMFAYVKEFFIKGGVDSTGLKEILKKYVDEKAIRDSQIDYGMVTVEFPAMTPHYLMKNQIPTGEMVDYLLASAACFPAIKSHEINHKKYVDGGYFDNLPIKLATSNEATHIIAVNLDAIGVIRSKDFEDVSNLTILKSHWDLGNFLVFDKNNSSKIMRLGYLDTLKTFGVFEGVYYSFAKGELDKRSLRSADMAGKIFGVNMETIYLKPIFDRALTDAIHVYKNEIEKDLPALPSSFTNRIFDSLSKAKSTFNQKSLTLAICSSLQNEDDEKNKFLAKPALKLFKDEILAANYLKTLFSQGDL